MRISNPSNLDGLGAWDPSSCLPNICAHRHENLQWIGVPSHASPNYGSGLESASHQYHVATFPTRISDWRVGPLEK